MTNQNSKFFISTAIPYVNAPPHLGFALEIVQADVLARYYRLKGRDVFFLTGTDENALKNVLAAKEQGIEVAELVDRNADKFRNLKDTLNLSWDDFIRTTEARHTEGAKKFWRAASKDIYKKNYAGLYCVGCEEFKTQKELVDDRCSEHPRAKLDKVEEENYFFRLSSYQNALEDLIQSRKLNVIPETRRNEVLSFIKQGLQDFSVSRSQKRAQGWGIPVPGDEAQILYVWFDALTNYITALGYVQDSEMFQKYWQGGDYILHVIGKGVSRFHAIYWPAMLISAGVKLPTHIFVHGYLTIDGQKISKSIGNVIDPVELVKKYGTDAVRYYLLREIPSYEDGDFSFKKFEDRYNGDLANGLGNLVARVAALGEKLGRVDFDFQKDIEPQIKSECNRVFAAYEECLADIKLNEALVKVWELISAADGYINTKKPWAVADQNEFGRVIANACYLVGVVNNLISPFLPQTAEKISQQISYRQGGFVVKKGDTLFPRLSSEK